MHPPSLEAYMYLCAHIFLFVGGLKGSFLFLFVVDLLQMLGGMFFFFAAAQAVKGPHAHSGSSSYSIMKI